MKPLSCSWSSYTKPTIHGKSWERIDTRGGNCHRGNDTIQSRYLGQDNDNIAILYILRYSMHSDSILRYYAIYFSHVLFFVYWESLQPSWRGRFVLDSDLLSKFCCDTGEERGLAQHCGIQKQCYPSRRFSPTSNRHP